MNSETCEVKKIALFISKSIRNMCNTLAGSLNDNGVRRRELGNPRRGWILGWPQMMGPTTDFSVMLQPTCNSLLSTSMMRVQSLWWGQTSHVIWCNQHSLTTSCRLFDLFWKKIRIFLWVSENPFSPIYRSNSRTCLHQPLF